MTHAVSLSVTRIENGEDAGIIEAGSVFLAIFDLGAETESVSTRVFQATRLDPLWHHWTKDESQWDQ